MSELLRQISGGIGTKRAMTIPELEGAKSALELRVEELELEVSELTTDNKVLEVEVLIKARVIKQLEQQLEGSRRHKTEVNQDDQ